MNRIDAKEGEALKKEIEETCTERNHTGQVASVWLRRKWRQLQRKGHWRSPWRRRGVRRRRSNKARDSSSTICNTITISSSRSARRLTISTALKPNAMISILEVTTSNAFCVCVITAIRLAVGNLLGKREIEIDSFECCGFLLFETQMLRKRTYVYEVCLVV